MFPLASNVNSYGSWSEWELSLERMQEKREDRDRGRHRDRDEEREI